MFYPKLYVPNSRFIFTEGFPPLDDLAEADVIVVQRMMLTENLKWIKIVRELGIKIIYDLDDDLWNIPPANPARRFFKTEAHIRGLEACAEWADVFTVSTETLQRVVRRKWGHLQNVASKKSIPVMVCENRVPLSLYCQQEGISHEHEGVVIGWSGSNTHGGDLAEIWQLLHRTLDEYKNVRLEIVGQPPPMYLLAHPRVKMRPWVHISEYPARTATWNWDIVLAPLEYHKFNESKSSIRMQEAGALRRPCLATSIKPYDAFVAKGPKELKYLLCAIPMQWENRLRELIKNASLRKELGEAMYTNVKENFSVEQSAVEWTGAINYAYAGA